MIVITGATGKIGSKTAAKLLAKGKEVKAIARDPKKLEVLQRQRDVVVPGDMMNVNFLTEAFKGAEAVMLIIPPNMKTDNIAEFQKVAGEVQLESIIKANVKNILFISSLGTEAPANGSLVRGLAIQEQRLNALPADFNVINLRPTGFMENLFSHIGAINKFNCIFSPLKKDLKTGIISVEDIATVAADKLENLSFKGKITQNLLGNRDYSQNEIASIVGKAIGKPDLTYVEISFEKNKKMMKQYGISESVADAMTAMLQNINNGFSAVERTPESTTPTSLEYFAEHEFKAAFKHFLAV